MNGLFLVVGGGEEVCVFVHVVFWYIVHCTLFLYVCMYLGTVYMRVSGSYLGSMYMYMYMSENYSWWEESEMK